MKKNTDTNMGEYAHEQNIEWQIINEIYWL